MYLCRSQELEPELREIERVVSVLLALAAVAIAVVLVHREFFRTAQPSARAPREPEFVTAWREIVPVGRLIGDSTAAVTIIEFADLECPFCRKFHQTIRDVRSKYPNDVAFVFVHLPLSSHRFARPAARAAECANSAGRFAELVNVIYEKQDSLGLKSWMSYAQEGQIGDTMQFSRCMKDTTSSLAVEAGIALATKLGINGTPTVILNGWRYPSPPTGIELAKNIEDLLAGEQPFASSRTR